jgi:hypothetical protein
MPKKQFVVSFIYESDSADKAIVRAIQYMADGYSVSWVSNTEIDVSKFFTAESLEQAKDLAICTHVDTGDGIFTGYELVNRFTEEN